MGLLSELTLLTCGLHVCMYTEPMKKSSWPISCKFVVGDSLNFIRSYSENTQSHKYFGSLFKVDKKHSNICIGANTRNAPQVTGSVSFRKSFKGGQNHSMPPK